MGSKGSRNERRANEEPNEIPMATTPVSQPASFSSSTHSGFVASASGNDKHSQFWDTFIKNARSPSPTDDLKDERKIPNIKM